jgi:oxygen-dependent protoporphyrinogen oxidase
MVGGARAPEMALLDDERLLGTVMGELAPILGIRSDPDLVRLFRWERAIPQYNLGHQERLRKLDEATTRHGGFYLTGNSYRGIGVNDCIENSYKLAEQIAPPGG